MAAICRQRVIAIHTQRLIQKLLFTVAFIVVISSLRVLSGCNRNTRPALRNIFASSDASGNHSGTADVTGPVTVTCVSAMDDTGTATSPACVIDAPGTNGVVKIGDKVAVTAAGKVVLSCQGKGTLACTARIEG
jgi:hypothetical protein